MKVRLGLTGIVAAIALAGCGSGETATPSAGKVTTVSDVDYTVVPDPSWPEDLVVIIDTASGELIESFPVNLNGDPVYDATGNSNREMPHGVKP